jgi:hypothetical protein
MPKWHYPVLIVFSIILSVAHAEINPLDFPMSRGINPLTYPMTREIEFVLVRNFPNSHLCREVKKTLPTIKPDDKAYGSIILSLHFMIKENEIRTISHKIGNIEFYSIITTVFLKKTGEGNIKKGIAEYFIVDLDNDGLVDMVDIVYGGSSFKHSDLLTVHDDLWILRQQPIPQDYSIYSIKKEIGLPTVLDHKEILRTYHITPFWFDKRNYLLFEVRERKRAKGFVVVELLSSGKLISHCHF